MSFKVLDLASDVASLVSAVNEVVSITASLYAADTNVKYFRNIASASTDPDLGGYWQTVYDAAPTSTTSTALFDITYGIATGSTYNVAVTNSSSLTEKIKIYRQFASLLLGNADSLFTVNSVARSEAFFISLKRNLQKDEIKKGTVGIVFNSTAPTQYTASDSTAPNLFSQAIGGDYAPLKYNGSGSEVGQVWYNSGIIVIPADLAFGVMAAFSGAKTLINLQSSGSINELVDGFRKKTERFDFHNQTDLHSTVFFCRAGNSEFNYSSNPTFVDTNKKIRVTSGSNILQTRTYVTTIGLYDVNDNLLAVAKLNKPIMKSPDTESIFRIRLDF